LGESKNDTDATRKEPIDPSKTYLSKDTLTFVAGQND